MNDGSTASATSRRPLVSVIVPALNEAENIARLIESVKDHHVAVPDVDVELVIVDDGSDDGTAQRIHELAPHDFDVRVVRLSRNFGSHSAISAGLERARGDCALVLGADGQEPTDFVSSAIRSWRSGAQIVWGVRRTRARTSVARRLTSHVFTWLFTRVARLEGYPADGPSSVLLDRVVIDALNKLPERNRNVLALVAWLGFEQVEIPFDQLPRASGSSRWTPSAMIKLAVDSVLQFSSLPLRLCSLLGLGTAFVGLVYATILVIRSVLGVETPSGWPTILVVVLVIGGAQLLVIGIMGEYVWRIIEEVRHRPLYVVREDTLITERTRPAADRARLRRGEDR